jgi:hypothetical protein
MVTKNQKSKTFLAFPKMDIYKCPKSISEFTFGNQKFAYFIYVETTWQNTKLFSDDISFLNSIEISEYDYQHGE